MFFNKLFFHINFYFVGTFPGAQNVLLIPRDPHRDVMSRWQLSVRARPPSDLVRLVCLQIFNFAKLLHI